jgi:sugar lactone lactonase YvrE
MTEYQAKRVLDIKAELGECPLWNVDDQCLYWLDIESLTINRFDPKSGKNTPWKLPALAGCFALREGNGAVIAAIDGYYDIDFASGAVKRVGDVMHPKTHRFNDGRTDRQGRLWAGTVHNDMKDVFNPAGNAYYRFDGKTVVEGISPVGVVNGTAFSPDGKTMYRSHTDDCRIFAHDYDPATGTASRQRVFAVVPDGMGLPDGATVDSDGGYWSAVTAPPSGGIGKITRWTPDGRLDVCFDMPVPIATMMSFGGPDLSTLYITTGRLEKWMPYKVPDVAGSIFAVETKFRGLPDTKFRYR